MRRENAFITTGLYPRSPNKPISRDYIVKDDEDPKYPNGRQPLNSAHISKSFGYAQETKERRIIIGCKY
ncbi:MAG: hypothetical protein EZS28_043264 [Streblomastix strix]|uniref:Uncharacterized protein n=1 Tax=Streblomastix strix TaxID=222440 RepID=A0A5J4TT78_9EUKA|nr:MAG: hypothetical protein EZS28_043264 [Streblomastix strix]